jgi:hypothetical protein
VASRAKPRRAACLDGVKKNPLSLLQSQFFFKRSSEETASLARKAGLDVQAVSVPGDHGTSVPSAMRQAIAFFRSK